ncbi:importin-4-like [Xiphophorus hellerii]|uniref:importin-4-like n=1 Tax=Xiphophorus hellerii TaxID=8084 RepID=UPI0013B398D5|nr:importin-4-like [Xiphophorus hellerii]
MAGSNSDVQLDRTTFTLKTQYEIYFIILQKEKCAFIPSLILALQHCIKPDENQVIEAMEVLTEEMEEIAVSIIVPHIADIVRFCLEVGSDTTLSDSLRVKALSCITFLIKLKSDSVLKLKLLNPILQTIFPILTAAPPPGEQDPEDEEYDVGHPNYSDNPKHGAAQMIDTMALHMPSDKLFLQLLPLTQACLSSENPYQKAGGLMCLAVLANGCAEYICSMMLSWMLLTVCQSLSDSNRVVRSAALFALWQFYEYLQPEVSKYCAVLMPLLLGYLTSLNKAKIGSVTKAFYVLENFMENLGSDVEPYLPTLMETMLSALRNAEDLKIKELAVSAIGALANAAKELLVPYFPPVIESLKGFLIATTEEMRHLQNQSLDMLTALIPKISKEDSSPLAEECIQLSLNLTHTINDIDLRRYTFCLYSAVSTVSPESLIPHLTAITTVMQLALKSNEGITAHLDEDKTFVLLDDDDYGNNAGGKTKEDFLEDDLENDIHEIAGLSVENAYIDEKKEICEALGKIALSTGVAFQPFLESSFQQVFEMRDFPHKDVRRAALGALGQFCETQHKVWTENRTETNHQALLKLLDMVIPCFVETVRMDRERSIVLVVLEAMDAVIESCKEEVFRNPSHLKEISNVFRDVLKKKTACQDSSTDEVDDEEQQAEFDDLLQFYAGEGILLVTSSVPADKFAPYLNDLLLIIMSKSFPHEDVRRAALGALRQFCQAQHKVWTENRTETNHQALLKLLDVVLLCFVETVRMDRERSIVLDVLKAMNVVIESCKEEVFRNPSHLKEISNVFRDVLKKKTACQDSSTDEVDDEEQQAEFDDLLQFYAGEGILLVTSSVPADKFAPYLNDLLLIIMSKSISSRTCRHFSSAMMIVEIFHNLKMLSGGREVAGQLWNGLLPVLVAGVKDSDAEVRSNSVFGLGCLAQAARPLAVSDYPMMLSLFSNMLGKESDLRVIDNLCAALCRMIMSDMDAVPLEQVVAALVTHLPLEEDQEENETVFNCLTMLYHLKPVLVVKLIKPIVAASSHIIGHKDVDEETQSTVVSLMKELAQKHGAEFQAAAASLPAEQQAKLGAAVTSS